VNLTENIVTTLESQNETGYKLNLKRNRSFNIEFSKQGYKTKTISIVTSDLSSKEYLKDILMEEESILSLIVPFEYKKSTVSKSQLEKLESLIKLMKDKPESKLLIIGRADSRGETEANYKLSLSRANGLNEYFLQSGIDQSRITVQAFGESLLLNDCFDNKPCKEKDHAINRVAEVKVKY
jgi:outer membrane protein OmpA-like peptidoglycan-associated protein